MAAFRFETERLVLREWRDEDARAHNRLYRDPLVAELLGAVPTLDQSREVIAKGQSIQASHGFCFWVLEQRDRPGLIGWCGLLPGRAPIEGEVEIGWTLEPRLWGKGLIGEAARACLGWAWRETALPAIAATTSVGNVRSRRVMERLGMTLFPDEEFDHPELAAGDPLRRHALYRIARPV